MTDTEIRVKGLELLSLNLGKVNAERFIVLINREPFDYTDWQQDLWPDFHVRDLSKAAMEYQNSINELGT